MNLTHSPLRGTVLDCPRARTRENVKTSINSIDVSISCAFYIVRVMCASRCIQYKPIRIHADTAEKS